MPKLMHAPKWFKNQVDLDTGDLVYFQRTANELGSKYSKWTVGEVAELERSADNKIRRVWVKYKNIGDTDFKKTERSARSLIKIFSLADTSILEDLWEVQRCMRGLLQEGMDEEDGVRGSHVGGTVSGSGSCCGSHVNQVETQIFMETYMDRSSVDVGSLWEFNGEVSYGDEFSDASLRSLLESLLWMDL